MSRTLRPQSQSWRARGRAIRLNNGVVTWGSKDIHVLMTRHTTSTRTPLRWSRAAIRTSLVSFFGSIMTPRHSDWKHCVHCVLASVVLWHTQSDLKYHTTERHSGRRGTSETNRQRSPPLVAISLWRRKYVAEMTESIPSPAGNRGEQTCHCRWMATSPSWGS